MDNKGIRVTVTLSLNREWAANLTKDELRDFVRDKINHSLGFRGEIKRLSVDSKHGPAQ